MSVMCGKVINLAQRQVGYKETGVNHTKYWSYFDDPKGAWQWFNTKKQGAEWCAGFICWIFCQNEILGPARARTFLGCPTPKDNLAATCGYFWGYLCKRGWRIDKKGGLPGDIIFFNTSKGECGHVGLIEKVDANKYYTIEGNSGNGVTRHSYSRTNTKIYGICRPAWAEIDPKPEPTPEPLPDPVIDPVVVELKDYKVVNIKSYLSIRSTPEVAKNDTNKVGELYNGAVVTVFEFNGDWARIGGSMWVSKTYLKAV